MAGLAILTVFAASFFLSALLSGGAVWIACQAVLTQPVPLKSLCRAVLALFCIGVGMSVLSVLAALLENVWITGLVALTLVTIFAVSPAIVFRRVFRTGWSAAAALGILYVMFDVAAQVGSTFVLKRVLVEAFVTVGEAMHPTLQKGDRIMALKPLSPQRWDVVVFRNPGGNTWVSRAVGLPNERVAITAQGLSINGVAVPAPPGVVSPRPGIRSVHGVAGSIAPLSTEEYFLASDNFDGAVDSRVFGSAVFPGTFAGASHPWGVPKSQIIGVVGIRYWPPERFKIFD